LIGNSFAQHLIRIVLKQDQNVVIKCFCAAPRTHRLIPSVPP